MKLPATSLPGLTPLRGIAALGVAFFHFHLDVISFIDSSKSLFVHKLYLMVDLFFIMSGFLILHVYKAEFAEKISMAAFRKFIVARFARIYPLHIITLLFLIGLHICQPHDNDPIYDTHTIPTQIFLLHSFPFNNKLTWNLPSWSISAEWWAYILFPVLCLLIAKNKKLAVQLLLPGIIACYILLLFYVGGNNILIGGSRTNLDISYDYGFLRSIAGFTTGMLLYLFHNLPRVKKIFSFDIFCGIFILLLLTGFHLGLPDIIFIPGFCILILLMTCNTGRISPAFNNKAFTFLGDISYSVYMLHFLLIIFINKAAFKFGYNPLTYKNGFPFLQGMALCAAYLVVVIVLAAISYRFVEKPCRRYINAKWAANSRPIKVVAGAEQSNNITDEQVLKGQVKNITANVTNSGTSLITQHENKL